ncbi:Toll-like receptor Tollo [Gryllus bimaculatus]|nr:Toll-like receptor Tollo [Gryllus bimaculatus]
MAASGRSASARALPLPPLAPLVLLVLLAALVAASTAGAGAAGEARGCACANGTLDCAGRQLRSFGDAPFPEGCDEQITKVNLQRNNLTSLSGRLNASVLEVVLSQNQLSRLPPASRLSAGLRALDVSRNRIEGGGGGADASWGEGWGEAGGEGGALLGSDGDADDWVEGRRGDAGPGGGAEGKWLESLEELRAQGNLLASLGFVPEPCALRVLDASANALEQLELALEPLQRCSALRHLDLSRNDLAPLPDAALQNLTELRVLDLSFNRKMGTLTNLTFDGLSQLRNLSLNAIDLKELPPGMLDGMPELEHLDLRRNQLSSIPSALFAWTPALRVLNLGMNRLTRVPADAIANCSALEVLDLGGNRIEALPDGLWWGFPRLRELSLHENRLKRVRAAALGGLAALQRLDVSLNRGLQLAAGALSELAALRVLRAAHCGLEAAPWGELRLLTNLTTLELSGNRLAWWGEMERDERGMGRDGGVMGP